MSYEAAVVIPAFDEEKRIQRAIFPLQAGVRTTEARQAIVVVDNGSTDNTAEAAMLMNRIFEDPNFDVYVINEPQKGTGAAADTGMSYAIEHLGANILARTDADTVPEPYWFAALYAHHKKHPGAQLVTGPVWRGYDEMLGPPANNFQKAVIENQLVPLARRVTRIARAIRYGNPAFICHFAPGYNMSTTSKAYVRTGGFPRTSIQEVDEDLIYNLAVANTFGRKAIQYNQWMGVNSSSRRLRSAGYLRAAVYYASLSSRPGQKTDHR